MPNMNRIRVNNVKYNFGSQQFDDFILKMNGKNTIYDLANGGGKSVLMLLLLQNLIPNCTLDDKQPIEKLFRTGNLSTTIHSLIEWNLDESDTKDGYQFMTTGFCARKAKDTRDDEEVSKDTASIEYFNYCIFYRTYNENDIINLPLVNNKERITYNGLKTYLRGLERQDLGLKVFVFDRKGEYQKFISRYGLYESEWEIIRGINRTEGHVRTYFETNYRTTRKVVEDLLIEEIIEKSFQNKTNQADLNENMAKTLLDIKDKLLELTKKKKEIRTYDHQIDLLSVLKNRALMLLTTFERKETIINDLLYLNNSVECKVIEQSKMVEELKLRKEQHLLIVNNQHKRMETFKVQLKRYALEEEKRNVRELNDQLIDIQAKVTGTKSELSKKESINDYLDYINDKRQRDENQEVINAVLHNSNNQLEELKYYAYHKKQYNNKFEVEQNKRLEELKVDLEKCEQSLIYSKDIERKLDRSIAIEIHKDQQDQENGDLLKEQLNNLRKQVNLLMIGNIQEVIQENKITQKDYDTKKEKLHFDLKELQNKEIDLKLKLNSLTMEEQKNKETYMQLQKDMKHFEYTQDRINQLYKVYQQTNINGLNQTIESSYKDIIGDMAKEKDTMDYTKQRIKQLYDKKAIEETKELLLVKEYIESKYDRQVKTGLEYLSGLNEEDRETCLHRFSLLPYGVVISAHYENLRNDKELYKLNLNNTAVPIFNESAMDFEGDVLNSKVIMFAMKDKKSFLDPAVLQKEGEELEKSLLEKQQKLKILQDREQIYRQDLSFVENIIKENDKYNDSLTQQCASAKSSYEETIYSIKEMKEDLKQIQPDIEEVRENLTKDTQLQEELKNELSILRQMDSMIQQLYDIENRNKQSKEGIEKLKLEQAEQKGQLAAFKEEKHIIVQKIKTIESQLISLKEEWDNQYASYYVPGDYNSLELSMEELNHKFRAAKAVVDKESITLADKKQLVKTLDINMKRSMKSIKKRQVTIDELEQLKENNELYATNEQELSLLSQTIAHLNTQAAQESFRLEKQKESMNQLSGSITYAIDALKERFGSYEEEALSNEMVKINLSEGKGILKQLEKEHLHLEKTYREAEKEARDIIELRKDIKRIFLSHEIIEDPSIGMLKQDVSIKAAYKKAEKAIEGFRKAEQKAKEEFEKYIGNTADTLKELNSFELAQVIKKDVNTPNSTKETIERMESFDDIIGFIQLEKDRVEKGIEDMEYIKRNFEIQCLQRCQDIKTELERLPKLSSITLDEQPVMMIQLSIPYVKEESYHGLMSVYIDEVVAGADEYDDFTARMKYIRSQLTLKKLFSVIVTDMNAIKLNLYKRERMTEQSRYLKYEEAVGSTGQSQGIYIQFLVSIINYISNIYSANVDNQHLKKVIFIDNPFGAAKDIYIWEPIFELLKTNQVQLVVPTRGATPAISSRFEVNYVLGQKISAGRQQTVVIDYRSQTDQEQLEYHRLEYQQATFL